MANQLRYHGREIKTIFSLFGHKEDDITSSLAWVLCNCQPFTAAFIQHVSGISCDGNNFLVENQHSLSGQGRTDLEIIDRRNGGVHIIVEAKRGWRLPGLDQLKLYANRSGFSDSTAQTKRIVTLSECSQDYFGSLGLPSAINGIPISHCSYKELHRLIGESLGLCGNKQKDLLRQYAMYLEEIMTIQNASSNWVYVVALSKKEHGNSGLSYVDIVEKHHKYFHPAGGFGAGGWPTEPPNYIGFRYDGKLQSIHHIDSYVMTRNLHDEFPCFEDRQEDRPYFVYRLGPAFGPANTVKRGNIHSSGHIWAMLDTLFTCETVAEASNESKKRMRGL